MRKQELVQLHALCMQVREYVERRYDLPDGAFERYDRTDVPPVAIYRKKEAHEEALGRLLRDLDAALATHVEEPSDRPAGAVRRETADSRTPGEAGADRRQPEEGAANRRG